MRPSEVLLATSNIYVHLREEGPRSEKPVAFLAVVAPAYSDRVAPV
jgi:hypothetical protein